MRQQLLTEAVQHTRILRSPLVRSVGIVAIVMVIWLVPIASTSAWWTALHNTKQAASQSANTSITNGAALWQHDTRRSAAIFPLASQTTQFSVDPSFAGYYTSHNGGTTLGNPLTPAYPTADGLIQFFTAGALLRPKNTPPASASDDLVRNGLVDRATGIVRLPLLQALLTAGSEAHVGGPDGTLTYVDLRNATLLSAMRPAPAASSPRRPSVTVTGDVFVPGGKNGKTVVGHLIPQAIFQYINSSGVSPDGWQTDYGAPLTEALPLTATRNGVAHHLLVQIFSRGGVVEDLDAPADGSGTPAIQRLDTGAAYLQTLGPPQVAVVPGTKIWATGDTAITSGPASTTAQAHIGQNFALALTGATSWLNGELWYGVNWQSVRRSGSGWVPATATSFDSPGNPPTYASFDVLSPQLATYLSGFGRNVGAVVYDETRGQYYTYNSNNQFIMASSAKVPIMLTFLTMTESQNREPNEDEMYLLTTMIENSDNDSAQALFDEIGGAGPMASFAASAHVSGLNPDPDAWGWSTVSPMAMVQFLALLHDGKLLNAQDRSLALNLMENIEPDQQNGVGNTAPSGATVAMKDGWVPAPDGLWAMNSSGIVTAGKETYMIAVYTQEDNQLSDGWTITQNVAGTVGKLLAK